MEVEETFFFFKESVALSILSNFCWHTLGWKDREKLFFLLCLEL